MENLAVDMMSDKQLVATILGVKEENVRLYNVNDMVSSNVVVLQKYDARIKALQTLVKRACRTNKKTVRKIDCPDDAYDAIESYMSENLLDRMKEHFMLIMLDVKNHIRGIATISTGSLTASVVHVREVFREAILNNSASVIIAHNHPSGDTTPSKLDVSTTLKLIQAGKLMDIPVLDHIIVGDDGYRSLKESGVIK